MKRIHAPGQPSLFIVPIERVSREELAARYPKHEPPAVLEAEAQIQAAREPEPDEDVTIEAAEGGRFWITFTRNNGTTRSSVRVTRGQVEKLLRRAPAALELG